MSAGTKNGVHTMLCAQVREALSDYLEGELSDEGRTSVASHLEDCTDCRMQERQLAGLMSFLHESLPPREPALDLWVELGPKVAEIMVEERLGLPARWRLRASRFLGNVAAGAILFTHALAVNTDTKMRKYLIQDPFRLAEEE